ncbi:MAG TPA: type II secretion system protein [Blastocatellia bacterium]|nr:type II secretion system protein [Blastocatellia bacterium]
MSKLLPMIRSRGRVPGLKRFVQTPHPAPGGARSEAGFTLLELVIVMTILVILASIAVVNFEMLKVKARETLLKDDLKSMRKVMDEYSADKEQLPQSLDDLVKAGYMRDVPPDPITGQVDWDLEMGDDPFARGDSVTQGVVDVHSKAPGTGSDGKAYSEY